MVMKTPPKIESITVDTWLNETKYPAYFANRDITKRMKKKHLNGKLSSPALTIVACAEIDGKRMKLDGHTRALAWLKGQLERPQRLQLQVYKVNTLAEVAAIYRSYNSTEAAETTAEYMYHVNKLAGFEPLSRFMRTSWKTVYSTLHPRFAGREVEAVKEYKKSLQTLDKWDVPTTGTGSTFSVGIKAGMLYSVHLNKAHALRFWRAFIYQDKYIPEVATLRQEIDKLQGGLGGGKVVKHIFELAKTAFDEYRARIK